MDNQTYRKQLIHRAYKYGLAIIKFIDTLDKTDFSSQVLAKQLIRSATSVGANIVEAQAASSKKDFTLFLTHALKSANESKFWLGLLRDSGKADKDIVSSLLEETNELARILGSSVMNLKGKKL